MATWQLYSVAANDFRWKISDEETQIVTVEEPSFALTPQQLQSVPDLLRQGSSRLAENSVLSSTKFPVFRTGSGKPVAVKQSSLSRALSILGGEDNTVLASGQGFGRENCFGAKEAVFQKGSWNVHDAPESIFPAGLEKQFSMSNTMFQTGSGKAVNISSTGLTRAKALLGLEENCNDGTFQGSLRKESSSDELSFRNSFPFVAVDGTANPAFTNPSAPSLSTFDVKFNSSVCEPEELVADFLHHADKPPPIKFHTAGGRSISVSCEALKRARSLLGDPDLGCIQDEKDTADPVFSFSNDQKSSNQIKEFNSSTPVSLLSAAKGSSSSSLFTSPLRSTLYNKKSSIKTVKAENLPPASNLMKDFDAVAKESKFRLGQSIPQHREPFNKNSAAVDLRDNGIPSKPSLLERPSRGVLVDMSNSIGARSVDRNQNFGEKRQLGRSFVSPFKKPRISKLVTPLKRNDFGASNGFSNIAPKLASQKGMVSSRYPFHMARLSMKEYLGMPPSFQSKLENLPDEVRSMNLHTAEKYVFNDKSGSGCTGVESFLEMLSRSGASMQYITKGWVTNHYKLIVWKLASYERCYHAKFSGKLLTTRNVLEELKYRYEREVNYGHRSAIKRILEGDFPPSCMMVLCISKVFPICTSNASENGTCATVELMDGWYSVTAVLDVLLSKKLAAGKLFVGQKLRIWGAGLHGWTGPVSPLEASGTASLLLHMNGTYRAHWASRLGFCKGGGIPLSFMSIKDGGGAVPLTLVGISRIYPVLYRERLSSGGFIVRSERMEAKEAQSFNQRRSGVVEGIISESQRANRDGCAGSDYESEEGAKIMRILERAAEPELLMAEMTSEQLNSFASYQAKLEALRQADLQKSLEKALQAAGLAERDVTPFMRVRVVGLTSKSSPSKCFYTREGLVTIWNPTEKQQSELAEGQAFAVTGLTPISSVSSTLYLQAKGSTTKWLPLSLLAVQHFEPFFSPRQSISLCKLGEVPMSREFDAAAVVIFVGQLYKEAHQKKQWVFVADGSTGTLGSNDESLTLLAITFSSPCVETDGSLAPINSNLLGSTVYFCNLIKRSRDTINNLWVAEATENSTYYLTFDSHCSHLKEAGASAERWAKTSSSRLEELRGKVLSIITCRGT